MATILKKINKNGTYRYEIQFSLTERVDGRLTKRRKTIALGSQYAAKQVERIKSHVEILANAKATARELPESLNNWLAEIDDGLRIRLAKVGIAPKTTALTLDDVFSEFEKSERYQRYAPSTSDKHRLFKRQFFTFFEPTDFVLSLDKTDAKDWIKTFDDRGLAPASIAGYVKFARTVFNYAVSQKLIRENPFGELERGSFENKTREFFVDRAAFAQLLDACPNQTWRTILALCRIGGLRCPSETLAVRWDDVIWSRNRMVIRDKKRKTTRIIPLFDELRQELEALFEQTEGCAEPTVVPPGYTKGKLRAKMLRIVDRAGLVRWPRLFHNLRGSRSCELFSERPAHVAAEWLGQSPRVALAHYLHATEADFQAALKTTTEKPSKQRDCKNACYQ